MKKRRFWGILLSLTLVLGMLGGSATNAFAASAAEPTQNETVVDAMPAVEGTTRTESFGPGDWYWGGVTFYDENGGRYKTINGDQVKIKMAYKWVDDDESSANLTLRFVEYGGRVVYYRNYNVCGVDPDADGYFYYESEWVDVVNGVDYRFLYSANSDCNCSDPRTVEVHIWIEVR